VDVYFVCVIFEWILSKVYLASLTIIITLLSQISFSLDATAKKVTNEDGDNEDGGDDDDE
jgi:hypothetical protein